MASWDIEMKYANQVLFLRPLLHIPGYRVKFHWDILPHVSLKTKCVLAKIEENYTT